jgi:hypothetical protein
VATDSVATDAHATDALATDALATDALATDALATDAIATDGPLKKGCKLSKIDRKRSISRDPITPAVTPFYVVSVADQAEADASFMKPKKGKKNGKKGRR